MKPKDLLLQLSYMESLLNDFSYEELSIQEVLELKKSFESFVLNLEEKVLSAPFPADEIEEYRGKTQNNHDSFSKNASDIIATSEEAQRLQGVRNLTVLVFEDSLLNQRLIEHRLKLWGCKTYITDDANYGLSVLENSKIDIVLMDLCMPVMNGYEIIKVIRNCANQQVNKVLIIALSAYFTDNDKQKCADYGLKDLILKPFDPSELLSKLIESTKKNII